MIKTNKWIIIVCCFSSAIFFFFFLKINKIMKHLLGRWSNKIQYVILLPKPKVEKTKKKIVFPFPHTNFFLLNKWFCQNNVITTPRPRYVYKFTFFSDLFVYLYQNYNSFFFIWLIRWKIYSRKNEPIYQWVFYVKKKRINKSFRIDKHKWLHWNILNIKHSVSTHLD